jgi:predicted TIM-barrel fold metal-dependent hydrolase
VTLASTDRDLNDDLSGLRIVDADTHVSERHDLWTSRVPAKYRDLVPHVETDGDGTQAWLFNGDELLHKPAGAASVIRRDGSKVTLVDWDIQAGMNLDEVATASWDVMARLEVMDKMGIYAAITYPNLAGFGANRFAKIADKELANLIVSVYNDAMAEFQASSKGRLFPMALVPYWDVNAAARETERIASSSMGLRGIAMCSEPQAGGYPDLLEEHWNPLWEVCSDLQLPVNFHVGASDFGMDAFMNSAWPSQNKASKHVVGSTMIELHNARVLANLLTSNLPMRYPRIRWVSVESGIGWIPYVLERLEYQLLESPEQWSMEITSPTEVFRDHVYGMFWFEDVAPARLLDRIGFDNVMFETDYPHPTCLYPSGRPDRSAIEHGLKVLEPWGPEVIRKVMGETAARLYRLPFAAA